MKREFAPERLDVTGFAAAAATLEAADPVPNYVRLVAELADPAPDAVVRWEVTGEERAGADGSLYVLTDESDGRLLRVRPPQ